MGNSRRFRRNLNQGLQTQTPTPRNPNYPLNLDRLVSNDEAHIGEVRDPVKKWFAKLANFLVDQLEAPPHILFGTLHRFYYLDLHAVVQACQAGIPWGTFVQAELIHQYWGSHDQMEEPAITTLVSALRTSNPKCNSEAMLLSLSRTSISLTTAVHALRWGGQYSPPEITAAIVRLQEGKIWGVFPPNRAWESESKDISAVFEQAGVPIESESAMKTENSTENLHQQLLQSSELLETVIGKWRTLRESAAINSSIPIDIIADAIGTAFDAATRLSTTINAIENCTSWVPPIESNISIPKGVGVQSITWNVPQPSKLPIPQFSPTMVQISWDMPFWYSKAADAFGYLATFLVENNEIDRAVRSAADSLEMARKSGVSNSLAKAQNNLAHVFIVRGTSNDLSSARELLAKASSHYVSTNNEMKLLNVQANVIRLENRTKGQTDSYQRFGTKSIDLPEFENGLIQTNYDDFPSSERG
jgi:hypothetical protein